MNTQTLLFALLRAEISGTEIPKEAVGLSDPDQLQKLYDLSKSHDMSHIVAQALERAGAVMEPQLAAKFQKQQMLAVFRYQKIQYELDRLCEVLEKAKIKHIPLKGSVLRKYYPNPWMRTSCDVDILVSREDLPLATERIVEELQYEKGNKNFHDCSFFSQGGVHLELHFDLIEEMRHPAFIEILSEVWKYTEPKEGYTYQYLLQDAFFYYYHVAHMVKHFEEGGCGIRPFLDLWILDHRIEYDASARDALLERGNLLPFATASRQLADVWFSEAAHHGLTERMEQYILYGGVYGSLENKVSVQQSKKGGRVRFFLSKVFPPFKTLRLQFPILKKHWYLAPVFVVVRWFRWVFRGDAKRTMQELNVNTHISRSRVDSSEDLMRKLGLQ